MDAVDDGGMKPRSRVGIESVRYGPWVAIMRSMLPPLAPECGDPQRLHINGLYIELWESPSGANPSQDSSLMLRRNDGTVRFAALDGVTPHAETPMYVGVDGAMWAAAVTRASLSGSSTINEALRAANDYLFDPGLRTARVQPTTMAVVVDLPHGGGGARVVRAGDCEAYVRDADGWSALFPQALKQHVLDERAALIVERPDVSLDEAIRLDESRVAKTSHWASCPVGCFENPHFDQVDLPPSWHELILTTDGAHLAESNALNDLDSWLDNLRGWERGETMQPFKRHDDVTVIRIRRS